MPTDRRWSDADREPIAALLRNLFAPASPGAIHIQLAVDQFTDRVLDALTADGWRREADVRVEVAEELREQAAREPNGSVDQIVMLHASEVARAHATTPEATEEDQHG